MKTVAVSGGFAPMHIGHIRLFKSAKIFGDCLVVILNNDKWLMDKKGYVVMPQEDRVELLLSLEVVDAVYITRHEEGDNDRSVCKALEVIRPNIFANGGYRTVDNIPETELCERLNIKMIFNIGG